MRRSPRRARLTLARRCSWSLSATGALPLWPVFVLCGVRRAARCSSAPSPGGCGPPAHRAVRSTASRRSSARRARSRRCSAGRSAWRWRGSARRSRSRPRSGIPHPVLAALVILPALDVASAFPITPGADRHRERRGRRRAREPRHRHDGRARRRVRDPGARDARQRRGGLVRDRSTSPAAVGRPAAGRCRRRHGRRVGRARRRRSALVVLDLI